MPVEIERKFIVTAQHYRQLAEPILIRQGYFPTDGAVTVRIRIKADTGYLTIKSNTIHITRLEYEYRIPLIEAEELLDKFCGDRVIAKKRFIIPFGGNTWEVDEFCDHNKGLVMAEIELSSETDSFRKPDWIGAEVTGNERFYNFSLINQPFCIWPAAEQDQSRYW